MIGLQVQNHLDVTSFLDSSRRGASKRACCDTLIVLAKLQCILYLQLQDSPGIDSILLFIHGFIEILGIVCL